MSTSMITGSTSTASITSNQKVIDMADRIYLLQPDAAPLWVLVSKLNKRVAINTKVEWLEDDLNPTWSYLSASATSAYTDLSAHSGDCLYFNVNDLVKVPVTGEVLLVTSVTQASSAITVVRGYGTTTAASAQSGSWLVIIGSAFPEGATLASLTTKSTKTSAKFNYLQLFRKSVQITKTQANVETYGGNVRAYERKKKGIELMRDFERMFYFGEPLLDTGGTDSSLSTATANAGVRRETGGINYFISTNSTDAGGIMTESDFEAFLRTVFRYNPKKTLYLFCAPLIISVISQWAQGKLQTFPKDQTYGIAITQYLSPHGRVNLVSDVLLEYAGVISSTSYYGGYAYAMNLDEVIYRYLQNRDVAMETDIQIPGDDFYMDQYICEIGCEFHQEQMHGKLYDVTG